MVYLIVLNTFWTHIPMPKNLLEAVKRGIRSCEEIKADHPHYYKVEWEEKHKLLLKIKEELEDAPNNS